ncbi:MAG: substrate-binding domain-containing protein [Bavariicoccus seileri]|uniref:substrate-binding domain-containing protein n=1 Tax=Bavariicoccus seileri TaxID=549685 RepID=UPI0003B712FB|nr:substrate-binding domain-containing protein [Bavariicoccus seileri]
MSINKIAKWSILLGTTVVLAACGNGNSDGGDGGNGASGTINVISREDGSGTRGAFTEITGILEKDGDNETDTTSPDAVIQNSTEGVLSSVAGDVNSIGYISLGSLNDTVKAVKIDGVEPTSETVLSGDYKVSRPFNIAWKGDLAALPADFVQFIHSKQGQEIAVDNGYVEAKLDGADYSASNQSGSISVVGSTSISPLMEKLAEAYKELNPDVQVDITANGSSAGMTAAIEGTADIGMASRELKDEEKAELNSDAIALDGIAVVVNKDNSVEDLTLDQVKEVFQGKTTDWEDLAK